MNMNEALDKLFEAIKSDYAAFLDNEDMKVRFNDTLRYEKGRKYIKVIAGSSVWGFIMKEDDKKFKAGDILKAASWSAPARNAARGNVFADKYVVQWTGPLYLV